MNPNSLNHIPSFKAVFVWCQHLEKKEVFTKALCPSTYSILYIICRAHLLKVRGIKSTSSCRISCWHIKIECGKCNAIFKVQTDYETQLLGRQKTVGAPFGQVGFRTLPLLTLQGGRVGRNHINRLRKYRSPKCRCKTSYPDSVIKHMSGSGVVGKVSGQFFFFFFSSFLLI